MIQMIKFLDLQKINAQYSAELKQVASEVIDSGWYLLGSRVSKFENELADYIGSKNAIGVANGLDALRLIIRAYKELGVFAEGDEIMAVTKKGMVVRSNPSEIRETGRSAVGVRLISLDSGDHVSSVGHLVSREDE